MLCLVSLSDSQSHSHSRYRWPHRSGYVVPAVLALGAATFLYWKIRTGRLQPALRVSLSVLTIACPCSLGLATPTGTCCFLPTAHTFAHTERVCSCSDFICTAITVAMGEAARMGVLIRKAESLERARNVLLMLSVPL